MDDLISRQAAIDALAKFVPYAICDESTESYTNGLTDAYNLILQLPSAQPEIIHCKECKYYRWESDMCDYPYATAQNVVHEDDFCSRAERRTDE